MACAVALFATINSGKASALSCWNVGKDADQVNSDALIAACTAILKKPISASDRSTAYSNRAGGYMQKQQYDLAMADYNSAIAANSSSALPWIGRASLNNHLGKHEQAISDATRAASIAPHYPHSYSFRGTAYLRLGKLDQAIADYSESIRRNPKSRSAYAMRGDIYRQKGDLIRASQDMDKQIAVAPQEVKPYITRAELFRYQGDHIRSLADLDAALKLRPDSRGAWVGRGLTFERMGETAKAREALERALASKMPSSSIFDRELIETARARIAAIDSGDVQPIIAAAPAKAVNENSLPTPAIASPILTKPAPSARASQTQERRVALVIGNSAYKNVPVLLNPQKDADAVAASLRNIGFSTVTLTADATREAMLNALRTFADEAEKADWAMVYYAGHGIEVNGVNYLIPVDAKLATDRDVQFEALPLDQVMTSLEGAKKIRLVVLDACRDNPFTPQMRKTQAPVVAQASTAGGVVTTRSIGRGLGEVKVSGASLVVYAAKHGQTALDGEGGNSPFAIALVQRLATPGVEINKIFRLVRDDVMEATAGRQEPFTYGSLPGREDFFFVAGR